MILILIVLVPQYTMVKIFILIFFLYYGVYLHCSLVDTSQESCLGTLVNGEHPRDIYIQKVMNECKDQTTCIS